MGRASCLLATRGYRPNMHLRAEQQTEQNAIELRSMDYAKAKVSSYFVAACCMLVDPNRSRSNDDFNDES